MLTSPDPVGVFGGVDAPLGGTVVFDEEAGCLYLGSSQLGAPKPGGVAIRGDLAGRSARGDRLQGQVIEPGMKVKGGGGSGGGGSYEGIRNVAGVAVADAVQACADHVDTDSVAFFNVGSEVDLVP